MDFNITPGGISILPPGGGCVQFYSQWSSYSKISHDLEIDLINILHMSKYSNIPGKRRNEILFMTRARISIIFLLLYIFLFKFLALLSKYVFVYCFFYIVYRVILNTFLSRCSRERKRGTMQYYTVI
jgi:hypothetical protein